jgi:hypothetical protein
VVDVHLSRAGGSVDLTYRFSIDGNQIPASGEARGPDLDPPGGVLYPPPPGAASRDWIRWRRPSLGRQDGGAPPGTHLGGCYPNHRRLAPAMTDAAPSHA